MFEQSADDSAAVPGPVVSAVWKQDDTGTVPETRSELTEAHLNTIGDVLEPGGCF